MKKLVASLAVVAFSGCQAAGSGGSSGKVAETPSAALLPAVAPLDLVQRSAQDVLQQITDSADPEVSFVACGDLLDRKLTLQTTERKTLPVLMAMLVTQLGAPATVDGSQWTLFCREAAGPGKRFKKGQPSQQVTVPKAPEGPK